MSSTTAPAFLPGVVVTGIPRAAAACESTFTGPPRAQHTSRRPGEASTASLTAAPWMTRTSCPLRRSTSSSGLPLYSRRRRSDGRAPGPGAGSVDLEHVERVAGIEALREAAAERLPGHVGVTGGQDPQRFGHGYCRTGFRSMAWPLPDSTMIFSIGSVSR